jgi:hypothetical protein
MRHETTLRTGTKQGRRHQPTQRQLEALRPTQFRPGETGNAGGRPKKTPITDALRELLDQEYSGKERRFKGLTNARVLALAMYEQAIAGGVSGVSAAKEITDRIQGRAPQSVTMGGPDGGAIPFMSLSREDNERRIAELLAIAGGPDRDSTS